MVSDWLDFVRHILNLDVMPLVMLIVICTGIGWLTHTVVSGLKSDLLAGMIFIIATGVAFENWQRDNHFVSIFLLTATVMTGVDLYRRLLRNH